jgi:hypothetical protein
MSSYPLLDLIWTMIVFFGWVIWFWLLIVIFGDLFHRSDKSGWAKAGWTVVLIVLPFIGVLIYLVAEGHHMGERRQARAEQTQSQFDDYVRSVAGSSGDDGGHEGTAGNATDQLVKAKKLLDDGAITQTEYDSLKQKVLAH